MSIHPDIFQDRKCIHVKLKKETHTEFKIILFKKGISMQEAFEEFAVQAISDTSSGRKILNAVAKRKLEEQINGKKKSKNRIPPRMSELDVETLYEVINGENQKEYEDD
jgi:hypothetical protein